MSYAPGGPGLGDGQLSYLLRKADRGRDRLRVLPRDVRVVLGLGGAARGGTHTQNSVDCLTKYTGNTARLLDLMKTANCKLTFEEEEITA